MSKIYIYGLYDPDTRKLRYVGKAKHLTNRLWYHIRDAKGGQKTHKANWIRKLLRNNKEPVIAIIKETSEENWKEDEKICIFQAKENGADLTNLTSGGEGIIGYNHSDETKQKISKTNKRLGRTPPNWKGKKQSPEHIRKRVEARKRNKTYKHTEQAKKNISKGRTGKGMGNTNTLGFKQSEETKRKKSISLKKYYDEHPEAKEEMREKMKGNEYARRNPEVECLCSAIDTGYHDNWCPMAKSPEEAK